MRRGIEAVRSEPLEKALAYNFCRVLEISNRGKESEEPTEIKSQLRGLRWYISGKSITACPVVADTKRYT